MASEHEDWDKHWRKEKKIIITSSPLIRSVMMELVGCVLDVSVSTQENKTKFTKECLKAVFIHHIKQIKQ